MKENGAHRISATDLANYLSCKYLPFLDMEQVTGKRKKPKYFDPAVRVRQKGEAYVGPASASKDEL